MEKALKQARDAGIRVFTASEAIQIRTVGSGEGIPSDDPDQAPGAQDPHLWMRPAVAAALREGEVFLVFAVVDPCPVPWNRSACKKNAREHRIYTPFTFFFPLPDNSAGTWGDTPCMSLSWRYL